MVNCPYLDPTNWSRNEVFAPVLSRLKLRQLITIAVRKRCKVNAGYFKQELCQSYFPDGETCVLRPPKYCPIIPPNMYLKPIRTLYVLNRSPRHWYEKAWVTFLYIGLKQNKNNPCIFSGSIMPDHPPIYVGLYIDDYIYISASEVVKT